MANLHEQTTNLTRREILENRAVGAVERRLKSQRSYSIDAAIALKDKWDHTVDARRVFHSLVYEGSFFVRRSAGEGHILQSCLLFTLPVEVISVVTCMMKPLDLFRVCLTCKQAFKTVVDETYHLSDGRMWERLGPLERSLVYAARCSRFGATRFMHELDLALCLISYIRQDRFHRYGTKNTLNAGFSAMQRSHRSGGMGVELTVTSQTDMPFLGNRLANGNGFSISSERISLVVCSNMLCVVSDHKFMKQPDCIAISKPNTLSIKVNAMWDLGENGETILKASFYLPRAKNYTVVTLR